MDLVATGGFLPVPPPYIPPASFNIPDTCIIYALRSNTSELSDSDNMHLIRLCMFTVFRALVDSSNLLYRYANCILSKVPPMCLSSWDAMGPFGPSAATIFAYLVAPPVVAPASNAH